MTTSAATPPSPAPWALKSTPDARNQIRPTRTREVWSALRWLWANSTLPSVRCCGRAPVPAGDGVNVALDVRGRATARGVQSCGSVWACSLCSARTWAKRARQLRHLLCATEAAGFSVGFVTLTMRHHRGLRLDHLWDAMAPALEDALGTGSRMVRRVRNDLGVLGVARRIEATWSEENGWNLHVHLLVFAESGDQPGFETLAAAMFDAWRSRLAKKGLAAPNRAHGVHVKLLDLSRSEEEIAAYVTAAGSFQSALALSKRAGDSARHGNRTTWQLLLDAQSGDRQAARLWAEWEQASKGRRAWDCRSPRLRQLAKEHVEQSEEAVPPPEPIVHMTKAEWTDVCEAHDAARLLATAEAEYRHVVAGAGADREQGLRTAARAVTTLLCEWGVWEPMALPRGRDPGGAVPAARPCLRRRLVRSAARLVTVLWPRFSRAGGAVARAVSRAFHGAAHVVWCTL